MKHLTVLIIGFSMLFSAGDLSAQLAGRYDKAFIQSEMNRYRASLQRRSQAAASTTAIDATYYRLDLTITASPQYLKGIVLMRAASTLNGVGIISLDLMNSMTIDSVKVAGSPASFIQYPTYFNVTLDRTYNIGEQMTVQVFYQGKPGSSGFGSFEFSSHSSTPWIWSLSEPYGAKDWWPSNDHPSDKADSVDMFVTCDTAYRVGSNGKLLSVTDNGNGTHTIHWHEGHPISTYLVSVAITNFAAFSNWFPYSPTDSMEVLNYVLPEHLTDAMANLPLVVGELQIYSSLFGLYPFIDEKYGHSEFGWGGGMEHQTMTSLGGFGDWLTAHELAHQWFGDMITCHSWPDIWLNEGFATFCELVYEEHKYGEPSYLSGVSSDMASARAATGSTYVSDSESVGSLFDWNRVYAKGAVVLHMLRRVLGDSSFFHSMYNYANDPRYRFSTASTENFKAVCETTSGKPLDYFFNEWIYGERYPHYSSSWTADSTLSGYRVTIGITQTTGTTNPSYFTMPVPFKIIASGWDTTVILFNDSKTQSFVVTIPERPLSVQLDPQNWILKDNDTLAAFIASPLTLDLGSVYVSGSKSDSVIVHNAGLVPLAVSSVVSDNGMFTVTPESSTVAPSSSRSFTVTFSPSAPGPQSGHIDMYHDASGSPAVITVAGIGASRTYAVSKRWNLLSLPVRVADPRTSAVFPSAIPPVYGREGTGYAAVETLKTGLGYWVKFDSSEQLAIDGVTRYNDSISVVAGWNLIGSLSVPVRVADIESDPPGTAVSNFFGYASGYIISDTIAPAKGYWVKVGHDCRLILSKPGNIPSAKRIRIVPDGEQPPPPPANEEQLTVPAEYALTQSYPNPFNPVTSIDYQLPEASTVRITVFNTLGQAIATLRDGIEAPGYHSIQWNAEKTASGVYFYKLEARSVSDPSRSFSKVRKTVLVR